ncbi:MAG: 23S rRNA (pseudouridine(1915)-N(3))-methyltransferase RlmH [Verrucomicrobiaceae bacterium]|nr:23S rRNA (pseudouridine(1915)-N(3))-methyltransferase RlmH [Verrucomicrobiaceae bacterium]
MRWTIITVGKPAFPWAREAVETYLQRLQRYTKAEHVCIRDGSRSSVESQMLALSEKALRIILDERGKTLRSSELARWIDQQQISGIKHACLLIGGADGHSEVFRQSAHVLWSLSSFTLQHEVALVVLLEQLYRAHTILKGEPYHRE